MKKHIAILALALACLFSASAQQAYWVFLADKAGTTFDPYTYFDAKAIERYQQCGADLYDITNYSQWIRVNLKLCWLNRCSARGQNSNSHY